jgi:hypothetical protein
MHDWADFVLKDGILINYNSSTASSAAKYEHFNLMNGTSVSYTSGVTASQAGIGWNGDLYSFFTDGVRKYNGAGGFSGSLIPITYPGGTWPDGAGDAAENFRPAMDFGDAPASYDPNPLSPAAHEINPALYLGANYDREWVTKGQNVLAADDNFDDGLSYTQIFNPLFFNYLTQATVFNNTGSNATVCAWLDYDGDGVYEASEGINVTVGSSPAPQQVYLYWPLIVSPLTHGSYTYLRIRITSAADGMTTAHATGYFGTGEVEDYRIPVNNYALSVQSMDFQAKLTNARTAKLNWSMSDETEVAYYIVERSASNNSTVWEKVDVVNAKGAAGFNDYESFDHSTLPDISYYRLKIVGKDGIVKISPIRKIENKTNVFSISLAPNPASSATRLYIHSIDNDTKDALVEMISSSGVLVYKTRTKINSGTNTIELTKVNQLPSGQYVIRVTCGEKMQTKHLIIKK